MVITDGKTNPGSKKYSLVLSPLRVSIFIIINIAIIIVLPEKFLPFDWLRAEVFQLNLKYLHVKLIVTMVTPNHQNISSHELRKNGGKISRFSNQEIQELK